MELFQLGLNMTEIVQKEKGIWKLPWEQNILRKLLHSKNSPFLMEKKEEDMLCNDKHAKQYAEKYSLRMRTVML